MPTFSLAYCPARLTTHLLPARDAPLPTALQFPSFGSKFSPVYLRRKVTRLVSYYALFK